MPRASSLGSGGATDKAAAGAHAGSALANHPAVLAAEITAEEAPGSASGSAAAELRLMQTKHAALLMAVQGSILADLLESAREAFAFWHWAAGVLLQGVPVMPALA